MSIKNRNLLEAENKKPKKYHDEPRERKCYVVYENRADITFLFSAHQMRMHFLFNEEDSSFFAFGVFLP